MLQSRKWRSSPGPRWPGPSRPGRTRGIHPISTGWIHWGSWRSCWGPVSSGPWRQAGPLACEGCVGGGAGVQSRRGLVPLGDREEASAVEGPAPVHGHPNLLSPGPSHLPLTEPLSQRKMKMQTSPMGHKGLWGHRQNHALTTSNTLGQCGLCGRALHLLPFCPMGKGFHCGPGSRPLGPRPSLLNTGVMMGPPSCG